MRDRRSGRVNDDRRRGSVALWTGLMIVFGTIAMPVAASDQESSAPEVKLLVLDIELVGDLGDAALAAQHEARIRKTSDQLRDELDDLARYEVVDATPAREVIEQTRATQYLHRCNGCEIDIARQLGAEQVLVVWIHRVSQLILSLTYEIRDVASSQPLTRKSFDFRGDNDTSWARAVTYMSKDLESRAAGR